MSANNKAEFSTLIAEALSFWGGEVTNFSLGVWWLSLQGYGMADLRKAFSIHAMDPDRGQFQPKPADTFTHQSSRVLGSHLTIIPALTTIGLHTISVCSEVPLIVFIGGESLEVNCRHEKFREFDRWLLRFSEEHPFQFEALGAAIALAMATLLVFAASVLR